MNSKMIRWTRAARIVVAVLCLALCVAMLLILGRITVSHASQSGIMIIAPSFHGTGIA